MRVIMKLRLIPGCILSDLELVRVHHPDSPHARDLASSVAQSRFQTIAAAYDLLRNPHLPRGHVHRGDDDMYMAEVNRRKAYYARHRGMGVRDWERQRRAMDGELDGGKWWNHDRAIVYAFSIIVRGISPDSLIYIAYIQIRLWVADLSFVFRLSVPYCPTLRRLQHQRWSTASIDGLEHT